MMKVMDASFSVFTVCSVLGKKGWGSDTASSVC